MAFCVHCGKPLTEGQRFCPSCGAPLGQAAGGAAGVGPEPTQPPEAPPAAAPPVAPPSYAPPAPAYAAPPSQTPPPASYAPYPAPGQPAYGPAGYPLQQPRSRKGLWISLVACLLIVAVACVLVFVVFQDDIFGGGGAASAPEQTVSKLLKTMENKDVDAMFALMDQKALMAELGGMSMDSAKSMLKSVMFDYQSVKFSGVKMTTKTNSGTTATVTITEGTVTIKDNDGKETSEDVKDADKPAAFDLTKIGGKWYIDPTSLSGLSGNGSNTPTTETTTGGTAVTTTEATGTTETAGNTGAVGSATPEDAVNAFLDALHRRDIVGVLVLMDPLTVEDALGMSIEDAQILMEGELFDYQSISFSGIKLSKESTGDNAATVTITEGSATITDTSGETTTEDVNDSGEPLSFPVVQENGLWYLDPTALFPGE